MKRLIWLGLLAALPGSVLAADESMARRADPWVPPAARIRSTEPPTEGAALQAQVAAKLRQRFDAADSGRYGSITRDQAQRAGLGFVSRHFDQIDARRSGSISFDELQRYLARRDAER
ncbi:EF-hand domain-containing protein [Aquabacterium sp.]|uniref:EF-hand domain-containing protein n=1 Tax=Aquabacterium sp. TaxID=1872578 RepID=UPI002CDBF2F3|nr:EF-hand domain-containing protein [Aquabacterium sp.]HSW04136.1 EF-hand domain-containing protein [Aquabacterium sp.]